MKKTKKMKKMKKMKKNNIKIKKKENYYDKNKLIN